MKNVGNSDREEFFFRSGNTRAQELLELSWEYFSHGLVTSSSFGIQSAVLLHMISRVAPGVPVIWIDTGYLPAETYRYAATLTERFKLDLRVYQSQWSPARMEALLGKLWESNDGGDLDRYHALRKVEPMQRALRDLKAVAWISGIRREQTHYRRSMTPVMEQDGIVRIHPLFTWSDQDVADYFKEHQLPRHPLESSGYRTVGDYHLSRPAVAPPTGTNEHVSNDDHQAAVSVQTYRETRFKGKREECGIHVSRNNTNPLASGGRDALFT